MVATKLEQEISTNLYLPCVRYRFPNFFSLDNRFIAEYYTANRKTIHQVVSDRAAQLTHRNLLLRLSRPDADITFCPIQRRILFDQNVVCSRLRARASFVDSHVSKTTSSSSSGVFALLGTVAGESSLEKLAIDRFTEQCTVPSGSPTIFSADYETSMSMVYRQIFRNAYITDSECKKMAKVESEFRDGCLNMKQFAHALGESYQYPKHFFDGASFVRGDRAELQALAVPRTDSNTNELNQLFAIPMNTRLSTARSSTMGSTTNTLTSSATRIIVGTFLHPTYLWPPSRTCSTSYALRPLHTS